MATRSPRPGGHYPRILPVTVEVAEEWGRLNALPEPLPAIDGLIAATAKVHRLTLVTRNVDAVVRAGVTVLNPFEPTWRLPAAGAPLRQRGPLRAER
ncbi:MAG TPA: PIN domain-containing protein [Micromonosporaceae bacterium]